MEDSLKKYFQPEISDIRVGYECEVKWHSYGEGNRWEKLVIDLDIINKMKSTEGVRVPYLTKEQIEGEGWEAAREYPCSHFRKNIDKDSYYSLALNESNQIVITKSFIDGWAWKWSPFYSGECKDINTFRYICKLLGV